MTALAAPLPFQTIEPLRLSPQKQLGIAVALVLSLLAGSLAIDTATANEAEAWPSWKAVAIVVVAVVTTAAIVVVTGGAAGPAIVAGAIAGCGTGLTLQLTDGP